MLVKRCARMAARANKTRGRAPEREREKARLLRATREEGCGFGVLWLRDGFFVCAACDSLESAKSCKNSSAGWSAQMRVRVRAREKRARAT